MRGIVKGKFKKTQKNFSDVTRDGKRGSEQKDLWYSKVIQTNPKVRRRLFAMDTILLLGKRCRKMYNLSIAWAMQQYAHYKQNRRPNKNKMRRLSQMVFLSRHERLIDQNSEN